MAIAATIEKLVSTKIIRTLENNLVARKICTMDTGSQIKNMGDTVYFPTMAEPTVNTYSGSVSYEDLEDGSIALLINQKKYFAFKIGKIEEFQSSIDLKGAQTERAAYKLRDTADAYVLGLYAGAENTVTSASVNSANVLETIGRMIRLLEDNNVEAGNRWMVIKPWIAEKLRLAGVKFQINDGIDGGMGGLSWVNYLDTDLFISNNVPTSGSEGSWVSQVMAGSYNAIVYAEQILETEVIEKFEGSFGKGIRGLHVYGAKVIKGKELVKCQMTQTAEA